MKKILIVTLLLASVLFSHSTALSAQDRYPEEEYYYLKYEFTEQETGLVEGPKDPVEGDTSIVNSNRMSYAHIIVNGTEVLFYGSLVADAVFNEEGQSFRGKTDYGNYLSLYSEVYLKFYAEDYSVYDITATKGQMSLKDYVYDTGQTTVEVEVYLLREESAVSEPLPPSYEDNENLPSGFEELMTSYGLYNLPGVLLLMTVLFLGITIPLVKVGVKGIAILIIGLLVFGLFTFMGLLNVWIIIILILSFIAVSIVILKGGGTVE